MAAFELFIKSLFISYEHVLSALFASIISIVDERFKDDAIIKRVRDKTEEAVSVLNQVLNRKRKNEFTVPINKADEKRIRLHRALKLKIEADTLIDDEPERQKAAVVLDKIMTEIGKAIKKSFLEKSNHLDMMFAILDAHLETIRTLGYEPLYQNLKVSEANLKALSYAGAENSNSKKKLPYLREAAEDAYEAMSKLLNKLDNQADEVGEPFKSVIPIINKLIEDAHKVQRAKITRAENEDTSSDTDKKNEKNMAKEESEKQEHASEDVKPKTSDEKCEEPAEA